MIDRQLQVQEIKQLAKTLTFSEYCHRTRHVLRLRSITVRGDNQAPGNEICGIYSIIPAYYVQTEIETGGAPCGREDRPFILIQHIFNHLNGRKAGL